MKKKSTRLLLVTTYFFVVGVVLFLIHIFWVFFYAFAFWSLMENRVSYSSNWPETHHIAKDDLEPNDSPASTP